MSPEGGRSRSADTTRLRRELAGESPLPRSVRVVLDAWTGGAPFGLALTGDAHRVERVFRRLRPHAAWVWRNADAGEPPPRIVRALALCPDPAALPPAVRRLCTVVVDIGTERASGRRPTGETEERLWHRVVSVLAAHGVRDGAIDVAACALASALVDADADGDPVALVRAWIALPHGGGRRGVERGASDGTGPADEDTTEGSDAENLDDAGDGASAVAAGDAPAGDDGSDDNGEAAAEDGGPDGAGDVSSREEPVVPRAPSAAEGASGDDLADTHAETAGDADGGSSDAAPSVAAPEPSRERQSPSAPEGGDVGSPDAGAPDAGVATEADSGRASPARAAALVTPEVLDGRDRARVRTGRRAPRGATRAGTGRGRPGRIVAIERANGRIAILPTVHAALQRHAGSAAPGSLVVTRDDLRGRLRAEPTAAHTVIVIDGSSSMGAAGAAHARRVADVALAHVYRDRGDVSVVLAAGSDASLVQARTPRVSRARATLQRASAAGGGGTPLADSVRRALDEFGDAVRERCRLVIVSDGQATVDLEGRADPRTAARDLRVQLDRASARAARVVFVPLDPRGYTPLDRTLAPFRAAGVVVVSD